MSKKLKKPPICKVCGEQHWPDCTYIDPPDPPDPPIPPKPPKPPKPPVEPRTFYSVHKLTIWLTVAAFAIAFLIKIFG